MQSQPSWAAWIEIIGEDSVAKITAQVAALLGCVD